MADERKATPTDLRDTQVKAFLRGEAISKATP